MPINNEQVKKRNHQMVALLVAAVVGALVIFGGGAYLFTKVFTGHVKTTDEYSTTQLVSSTYSDTLTLSGSIKATSSKTVSAKVDGTVSVISVKEGKKVKKGDTLFKLENDSISSTVTTTLNALTNAQDNESAAKENLESAQEKVTSAQSSLNDAKKRLQKAQAAAEKKQEEDPEYEFDSSPYDSAVESAQSRLEDAQSSVELMQSTYDKAQTEATEAQTAYDKAKTDENNLTVTAPMDGTVTDLNITEGDSSATFNANGGAMKIVDMDSITCVVKVPEAQVGNISQGQTATVSCEGVGETFTAIVSRVSDTPSKSSKSAKSDEKDEEASAQSSDEASAESSDSAAADDQVAGTTYDVTLTLDKTSKSLKVGMSSQADIVIQDYGVVYYVPASAVSKNNSGMYVESVVDGNTIKQYSVVQIASTEDGQLVIQGASLTPGMNIRTDLS